MILGHIFEDRQSLSEPRRRWPAQEGRRERRGREMPQKGDFTRRRVLQLAPKFKKLFHRFGICDSLSGCFSKTMIALQIAQLEKKAAKGLCLEFILHEYAKALARDRQLVSASEEMRLKILEELFADPLNPSMLNKPGILDKLCFYCEALVQNSQIGENLLHAIDDLRHIATQLRSTLDRHLRSIPCLSYSTDDLLDKLHEKLLAFFFLLSPVFQSSIDSEAALFSLLELRKSLNYHLGENTVENLLQQLFPDGPEKLRQSISMGFSHRGFNDFCQRHEKLFGEIAWSQPTICAQKP